LLDQKVLEPLERRDIEMVRRLVEEQNVRVIEEQARQAEPRSLATRERCDLAIDETAQAETAEDAPERGLEVVTAGVFEMVLRVGVALECFRIPGRDLSLQVTELALQLAQMRGRAPRVLDHRSRRFLEEFLAQETDARTARVGDRAAIGCVETRSDPEERRFPRSVRTDEAHAIAVRDAERHILQYLAFAIPARDGLDREHAHRAILRRAVRVAGARWHRGQWKVPRPPTTVRTTARPQRGQGSPARS